EISVDGKSFSGYVERKSAFVNNLTQMGSADIVISGAQKYLNRACIVKLYLNEKKKVKIVPFESLRSDSIGDFVFLFRNKQAIKQNIKTGIKNNQFIEIIEGLNVGDTVVTIGSDMIKDKQNIKLRQAIW
ncbi:MAG: hypothetical protein COX48_04635, partial [bacterium (Candidatus Stahlbacteria) CG23_combo_of_CG06-09_8_20_14_all_34_7]